MPNKPFIDFPALRARMTMEQVLQHYGVLHTLKRSGPRLSGPCPIHGGSNPSQFRVDTDKNIWNCFSECKHGGNVLDFIAKKEVISIHDAALKACEWFGIPAGEVANEDASPQSRPSPNPRRASPSKAMPVKSVAVAPPEPNAPNAPLKFRLDRLDTSHPYFAERGISDETIKEFGLGYFTGEKGVMVGRIVIPIHNAKGELVAYAGRFPGEPPQDTPKYKLPAGFRKSQELFNFDRASKEPKEKPLVIVEGFFDVIKLHQHGCRKVVGLMGSTLSTAQEKLLFDSTTSKSLVLVMLDEDDAGRVGRADIVARLSRACFVKAHEFAEQGMQPEHLSRAHVTDVLASVS